MKKTLIALAALAVVSAASAQSTVTLYGVLDMGVTQSKDTNTGPLPWGNLAKDSSDSYIGISKGGALSSNRLGFKGTEDLGSGMKADFVYELGINPDVQAATAFSTRLGNVGLSGNFGAVTMGVQYTPYFNVQAAMDLYGNNNAVGYIVLNHTHKRNSNAVNYATPNIGGFSANFQVGTQADAQVVTTTAGNLVVTPPNTQSPTVLAAGREGKAYGMNAIYAAGPLVAGFAYDYVSNPNGPTTATGFVGINGTGPALGGFGAQTNVTGLAPLTYATTASDSVATWAVGASYDFRVVKASLAYSSLTDALAGRSNLTSKGYNLSVAAPFGAVTVLGNFGTANLEGGFNNLDGKVLGYQVGVNYALSKRTTVYALTGLEKLDITAYNVEFKKEQTSVGVRHTF